MTSVKSIDFKISNLIMGVTFKQNFNIINLYELLPIVNISVFTLKKRDIIPFFGVSNCLVSCQNVLGGRGIRKFPGLRNSIGLDFQGFNKNIHIKVSTNSFHITGIQSFEMGKEAAILCCHIFMQTDEIWKGFYKLGYDLRVDICKYCMELVSQNNEYEEVEFLTLDSKLVIERLANMNESMLPYYNIIIQILLFTYEFSNITDFFNKLNKIVNIQPLKNSMFFYGDEKLSISTYPVYYLISKYKYPHRFFLPDLANFLHEKGFIVCYQNFTKPNIMILAIPIMDSNKDEIESPSSITSDISEYKNKKIPMHLFTINTNGTTSQSGQCHPKDAYEKYLLIRGLIYKFYEEFGTN